MAAHPPSPVQSHAQPRWLTGPFNTAPLSCTLDTERTFQLHELAHRCFTSARMKTISHDTARASPPVEQQVARSPITTRCRSLKGQIELATNSRGGHRTPWARGAQALSRIDGGCRGASTGEWSADFSSIPELVWHNDAIEFNGLAAALVRGAHRLKPCPEMVEERRERYIRHWHRAPRTSQLNRRLPTEIELLDEEQELRAPSREASNRGNSRRERSDDGRHRRGNGNLQSCETSQSGHGC